MHCARPALWALQGLMPVVLHDRVAEKAPTSLRYLMALEELTICGEECLRAANEFLFRPDDDPRSPLLPVSLQVLRIDASPKARLDPFWWWFDYEAAASATIPVLELRVQTLALTIFGRGREWESSTGRSCLPEGFSSLQLCTERIELDTCRSIDMRSSGQIVHAEQELCLFFLFAPPGYNEFRIYAPDGGPPMAAPQLKIGSRIDQQLDCTASFHSLGVLGNAMRRTPEAQSLDIDLLQDQQCLRIVRL